MLKNILFCFVFIITFISCNKTEKQNKETKVIANDSIQINQVNNLATEKTTDTVIYSNFNNTIIHENFKDSTYAKFSDLDTEDKFTFFVPKGNVNHTKSVLKIFNKTGDLIYENSFTTRYLVNGYEIDGIKTDEEMAEYILTKAKDILENDSFIDISDKNKLAEDGILNQPKEEFENPNTFVECQNEKRPLFCISLGEEDMTFIGYSKKLKKVVDVIYCC